MGQRVATDGGVANSADGKTAAQDPDATAVHPKTWRELTVVAGDWEVQVLEPLKWIRSHHVKDGSEVALADFVDLAEMGAPAGLEGTVESITACPTIADGPGRVVLATVSHLNNDVYDLTLTDASGITDNLGVTGYHRFYDEAKGWTDVQDLYVGEILRGDHGDVTVTTLTREPGIDRVYNMTVEGDHVYYVGDLSALVHNACSSTSGEMTAAARGRAAHANYHPLGYDTEYVLPSGRRPDAVDFIRRIVRELKPDNPRAIRKGMRQVAEYVEELTEYFGPGWTGGVEVY